MDDGRTDGKKNLGKVSTIISDEKSCKSELFSRGKQMFEVGDWVWKYFENWAFRCENILKIGRLVRIYFEVGVWVRKYFEKFAFGAKIF